LAFFHLLTHALFKALLFICAGGVIHSTGDSKDICFIVGLSVYIQFASSSFMVSNFAVTNTRHMEHIKMSDIRLAVRNSRNHLKQTGYHSYTLQLIRYELDSLI
jgi:NADH-ubiquinone oxidoreductase chain 5